jgi:DNA-binding NarL/FixJ family response regulator
MAGKTNRSNGYQHLFAEQSYSHEMLADFAESQGMNENYSPEDHEMLLDLHEQLTEEFWKLVNEQLTPRQAQVLKLLAMGYTQIEIAKQLNVNQSSITKSVIL